MKIEQPRHLSRERLNRTSAHVGLFLKGRKIWLYMAPFIAMAFSSRFCLMIKKPGWGRIDVLFFLAESCGVVLIVLGFFCGIVPWLSLVRSSQPAEIRDRYIRIGRFFAHRVWPRDIIACDLKADAILPGAYVLSIVYGLPFKTADVWVILVDDLEQAETFRARVHAMKEQGTSRPEGAALESGGTAPARDGTFGTARPPA